MVDRGGKSVRSARMSHASSALTGSKVLVVEDNPQVMTLLQDILRSCGAVVTPADTGRGAMLLLQKQAFDLVVMDVVMPQPDGWAILQFMRQVTPGMLPRTILVTGDRYHVNTTSRITGSGMRVVYKPFSVDELRTCATDALHQAVPAA
jgi:CheY-like chemotaxis protein